MGRRPRPAVDADRARGAQGEVAAAERTRAIVFACATTVFTLVLPRALLGLYVPWALCALVAPAIAWNLWRGRSVTAVDDRATFLARIAVSVASVLATGYVVAKVVAARRAPDGGVTVKFPLRSGRYVVAHGGSNIVLNQHAAVHAQSFALDISKVGAFGFRARGLYPSDVHRYMIFGDPIYSPCTGTVILTADEFDDLSPPNREPRHPGGNHVVVFCEGVSIVLAHMQRGSIRIAAGDAVSPETILGAVGNSGNTSEPHLHIHAVRGEVTDATVIGKTGEPVPLYFDGRFLVRNDVVESR